MENRMANDLMQQNEELSTDLELERNQKEDLREQLDQFRN